jgi:hypothetical protein
MGLDIPPGGCPGEPKAKWELWEALLLPYTKSGQVFISPQFKALDNIWGEEFYCHAHLAPILIDGKFYVSYMQNNFEWPWSWQGTKWTDGREHYGFRYGPTSITLAQVEDPAGTVRLVNGIYTEIGWEPFTMQPLVGKSEGSLPLQG